MVREISAGETLPLRSSVLRSGLPPEECVFDCDSVAVHFGSFEGGRLMAISTIYEAELEGRGPGGYRLRGVASDPEARGRGFGKAVVLAAEQKVKELDGSYIWFNARANALDFYKNLGFGLLSGEFIYNGLAHYLMFKQLDK